MEELLLLRREAFEVLAQQQRFVDLQGLTKLVKSMSITQLKELIEDGTRRTQPNNQSRARKRTSKGAFPRNITLPSYSIADALAGYPPPREEVDWRQLANV